jgi:GntR family transcriptional regulator of abcA and norABC
MDEHGHVIYVGSFSKTIDPGLRLGWITGSAEIIRRLSDLRMQTDYGSSTLNQWVVKEILESGEYESHLIHLRKQLKKQRDTLITLLETELREFGEWHVPKGGFFIWFQLFKETNPYFLFKRAKKAGLLINPGLIYNQKDRVSIRLSFAYLHENQLVEAITRLKQVLHDH